MTFEDVMREQMSVVAKQENRRLQEFLGIRHYPKVRGNVVDLDRVARDEMYMCMKTRSEWTFSDLRTITNVKDGTIRGWLRQLQKEGLIWVGKTADSRRSVYRARRGETPSSTAT